MRNDENMRLLIFIIGSLIFIIIVLCLVLASKQTMVVNNYISAGNYTFDVGSNVVKVMELSKI